MGRISCPGRKSGCVNGLQKQGWESALAYTIQIYLETGQGRVPEANAGTREQWRELALDPCGEFTWRQGQGGSIKKRSQAECKFIVGEG